MDGFSWPRRVQHCHFIARGQLGRFNPHSRLRLGNSLEMKNAVCVYLPRPDENQRPRYAGGQGDRPPLAFLHVFLIVDLSLSLYILHSWVAIFFPWCDWIIVTGSVKMSRKILSLSLFFFRVERELRLFVTNNATEKRLINRWRERIEQLLGRTNV